MLQTDHITAGHDTSSPNHTFHALNPATGEILDGDFIITDTLAVNQALQNATYALKSYRALSGKSKAAFLRAIAAEIIAIGEELITRAVAESGLPTGRITGEMGRTTGQLLMFAQFLEEGSWVDAVIDEAQPDRTPLPRPDIRRMLVPIGPVVVFGASNFPLAFSVAGGDTASALASGCPVIVKAHPAHPGTSKLVGQAVIKAAQLTAMPQGVFSLLFDDGYQIGAQLVQHPQTKAVAFTGSFSGGMALIKLARERQTPIPVFTEMGSINPVVLLPGILNSDAEGLAAKLAASVTLGAGQFCTNPGLILAVQSDSLEKFIGTLGEAIKSIPSATMLTQGIYQNYQRLTGEILAEAGLTPIAQSTAIAAEKQNQSVATVARISASKFISNNKFAEEIFGPWSLIVVANDMAELQKVIQSLQGQLTATIMAERAELGQYPEISAALAAISGRIILNGVPTGVEVCAAMQHGGPFPATSDSRFTSVGTRAIYRFVRPVAWQDWEDSLLPAELQAANPLNIWRQVNNTYTRA